MISLRKEIEASGHRFQTLLKVVFGLVSALPSTAVEAGPDLTEKNRANVDKVSSLLKGDPTAAAIDEAGQTALRHIESICGANRAVLEERDTALKDVVASVAAVVGSFRGHGERHGSNLTKLAESFDELSRLEDVGELRRRLRENVLCLRRSLDDMQRESEESAKHLETQISTLRTRLELVRKGADVDRLTGLGSRRDGERKLQQLSEFKGPVCVLLFDVQDFGEINQRYGNLFGDKILQALVHMLRASLPEDGVLFRWGADEFLAIADGPLASCVETGRRICDEFRRAKYILMEAGRKIPVTADVAFGAAQYVRGESAEDLCRRCRKVLDASGKVQAR